MLSFLTDELGRPVPASRRCSPPLVATVVGVLVGLPALRLRGLTARRRHAGAGLRHRGGLVPQHRHRRASSGSTVDGADAVRHRPRRRRRARRSPAWQFGLLVPRRARGASRRRGVALLRRSSLGSAMLAVRANERSAAGVGVNVVRVKVRQLRDRLVHRRARRLPARLPPGHRHLRARSPRSSGWPCSPPPTSPASPRCSAASLAGIIAAGGIVVLHRRPVDRPRATGSPSSPACCSSSRSSATPRASSPAATSSPTGCARPPPCHEAQPTHRAGSARARRRARAHRDGPAAPARRSCSTSPTSPSATAASSRSTTSTLEVRAGRDRRAHRPERRRQDERDRRDHRLRPGHGHVDARRRTTLDDLRTAPAGAPRPRPHVPGARAVRRPLASRRTSASPPSASRATARTTPSQRALELRRHRPTSATGRPATSARASASSCRSPGPASADPQVAPARRARRRPRHHREPVARRAASAHIARRPGPACCSSTTTSPWCSTCATTSTCSTSAGSSPRATPAPIRADRAVAEAYLGDRAPRPSRAASGLVRATPTVERRTLDVRRGSPAATARPRSFRDIDLAVEAGTVVACSARTAPARPRCCSTLAGLLPAQAGHGHRRRRAAQERATRRAPARPGVVLVPDDREPVHHADGRGEPRGGPRTQGRTDATRHARPVPGARERGGRSRPARSPAASSRCSPWPGRSCRSRRCCSSTR